MATDSFAQTPSSSIMDALYSYEDQQSAYRMNHSFEGKIDRTALAYKSDFYKQLGEAYTKRPPLRADRKALRFVKLRRSLMQLRLRPNLLRAANFALRMLYLLLTGELLDAIHTTGEINKYEKERTKDINKENLKDSLRKFGFASSLDRPLQNMLHHNLKEFHIHHFEPRYPDTDFVLHFNKIPGTEKYIFSRVDASARQANPNTGSGRPLEHNFPLTEGINLSASQTAAIVHNRKVALDINGKETWVGLQELLRKTGRIPEGNSIDLKTALDKWPIAELENPLKRDKLFEALKRDGHYTINLNLPDGNRKAIISINAGTGQPHFHDQYGRLLDMPSLMKIDPDSNKSKLTRINQGLDQAPVYQMSTGKKI